jgi:hypothetical protein
MYKVCKRTIERGNYPEDMKMRINVFYGSGLISTDEYNYLINILE